MSCQNSVIVMVKDAQRWMKHKRSSQEYDAKVKEMDSFMENLLREKA